MASLGGFWRALKALWQWGDQLAPLLEDLPRSLATAGQALKMGGTGAVHAGQALDGAAAANMQQMIEAVAGAVSLCNQELSAVAGQLDAAGHLLQQVAIPVIEPTTTRILGVEVVTGFRPATVQPFEPVNHELETAAASLRSAGRALGTSATHLRTLRTVLQGAGQDLDRLGQALQQGGEALMALHDE